MQVNALLQCCVEQVALGETVAGFKLIERAGLTPDGESYRAVMTVAVDAEDFGLGLSALKARRQVRFPKHGEHST